jgi:hypothetical protein
MRFKNNCFRQGWKVIFEHCRESTYKAEVSGILAHDWVEALRHGVEEFRFFRFAP